VFQTLTLQRLWTLVVVVCALACSSARVDAAPANQATRRVGPRQTESLRHQQGDVRSGTVHLKSAHTFKHIHTLPPAMLPVDLGVALPSWALLASASKQIRSAANYAGCDHSRAPPASL